MITKLCCALLSLWFTFAMVSNAQADWSAWVYEPETGRLLRIEPGGSVLAAQQITPPPNYMYPETVITSPAGDHAAAIVIHQDTSQQILLLIDLETGVQTQFELEIPEDSASFRDDFFIFEEVAYSADGVYFVYTASVGGVGWHIGIIDTNREEIRYRLDSNDPITAAFHPLHDGTPPLVQSIYERTVTFSLPSSLPTDDHSYRWSFEDNTLQETIAAPSQVSATWIETGVIVSALYDPRFPAEIEGLAETMQQRNTLSVYQPESGTRVPFFTVSDLHVEEVHFIQGGATLIAEAALNPVQKVWVIIGRDGDARRRLPVGGTDLIGTPDGFIYTTLVENKTAIVTVKTNQDNHRGETMWLQDGVWRIVWAELGVDNDLDAWAQLAEPLSDPNSTVNPDATPTGLPAFPPLITVGMEIQIYMPEDGYLNMRAAPTTQGDVLALLESGTRAIITDGPREADGFIWWEIQLSGRRGWVVEALPDTLTLIPPQDIIIEATEEATAER